MVEVCTTRVKGASRDVRTIYPEALQLRYAELFHELAKICYCPGASPSEDPRSKKHCESIDLTSPKDMNAFQTIKVAGQPEGPTKRGLKRWWKVVLLVCVPNLALWGLTLINMDRPSPKSAALLEVQRFRIYRSNGSAHMIGEVKNIGDKPVEDATAVGSFYDAYGNFVESHTAIIEYRPLPPGRTSPFEVLAPDNRTIVNGRVEFIDYFSRALIPTQIISGLAITPPRGVLDSPSPNASVSGPVLIWGWAVDQVTPSTGLALTLLIDGAPVSMSLAQSGARPDVCAVLPENSFPGACQSGFSGTWNPAGLTGAHTVAVRVTNGAGPITILGPVPVTLR